MSVTRKPLTLGKFQAAEKPTTRKLQMTGGEDGSFAITLPKDWVRRMEMKRNAEVNVVVEEDGRLTIYPKGLDAAKLADRGKCPPLDVAEAVTIVGQADNNTNAIARDLTNKDVIDMFLRKIISAYLIGYTEITLKGRISKSVRDYLLDFVKGRLFGLGLSSSGQDHMTFRMYHHTMNIDEEFAVVKDATTDLFKHLLSLIKSLSYNDDLADFVNKDNEIIASHHFYIIRLLKAAADNPAVRTELKLRSGRDLLGARILIQNFERISNHAKKIVDLLKDTKDPVKNSCGEKLKIALEEGIKTASESFGKVTTDYPLLKEPDFDSVNKAVCKVKDQHRKMIEYRDKPPDDSKVKRSSNLRIIIESVGRVNEYTSNVGEVILNLAIESHLHSLSTVDDKTRLLKTATQT